MASPSHSEPEEEQHLETQNPNPTQDQETESPQQESTKTQTLELEENPDPQNLESIQLHPPQDQHQSHKDDDQEETQDFNDPTEQSGMSLTVPDDSISELNPPPLTSPTNRRPIKRKNFKKTNSFVLSKRRRKIEALADKLKPIPFIPTKALDFEKHEEVLKRLGLWDFVHIEFDRNIRVDLLAPLILNYDSRKRCSYVNDFRIHVNRAALARALKLPPAKAEKGGGIEEVDLDSEAYSEESISFLENLVSNWVLLHEDSWIKPAEIANWTRVIRDGHPEKVEWANLIWFMVDKELAKGDKLVDCYYASHLQYLIKLQREGLFDEEPKVEMEVEVKEEDDGGDGNVKEEENASVEEPNVELTLGQDVAELEEVKDDEMDADESKEEQQGNWLLNGKNNVGEHFLQHCHLDVGSNLNIYGERNQEEDFNVFDERKQEVEGEEEEEEMEERDDEFDMEANDDSLERDGLTGNLLQGMETAQTPFNSQGELREIPSVDLFTSRDGSYMISDGPSFFGNGSKRVMEPEHDIPHPSVNASNKRLRTDESWDQKLPDFGMIMDEMQQLAAKAKMIYESKEHAYEDSLLNHQYLINELQERQTVIGLLQKSKDEEIEKKNTEIFRLERELYLMGDLLAGYRRALKETQNAFSEYRQLHPLPEEPLYKDAGPGGVVLSTRDLEKQRQKQEEEDRVKRMIVEHTAKSFEEEFIAKLKVQLSEVLMLDEKLVCYENEVQALKELSAQRRIQKHEDALPENNVSFPSPDDAAESQDVGM